MATAKVLKSVRELLNNVRKFDDMTGPKQAAYRAQLTRVEKLVTDEPELAEAMAKVRQIIGAPETKSYRKQTPDELVKEYSDEYLGKSGKERGAFKAKVTRMLNTAKEESDTETVLVLEALQDRIQRDATASSWKLIRNLSSGLDDLLPADSE